MAKTSASKADGAGAAAGKAAPAVKKVAKTSAQPKAPKQPAAAAAEPATARTPAVKPAAVKPAVEKPTVEKPAAAKAGKAKPEPKAEPELKPRKPKLVRDSFTMPEAEYAVLGEIKKACLKAGIEVKKSELLRAGVALLKRLDTEGVKEILAALPSLKAGRPKKAK